MTELFLAARIAVLSLIGAIQPVASDRQAKEFAADEDVLQSLRRNNDVPTIVRPVDARFVGPEANISVLARSIRSYGYRVIQLVSFPPEGVALDTQRDQQADGNTIRRMTEEALQIEAKYGVRYDGWGCVAQTGAAK